MSKKNEFHLSLIVWANGQWIARSFINCGNIYKVSMKYRGIIHNYTNEYRYWDEIQNCQNFNVNLTRDVYYRVWNFLFCLFFDMFFFNVIKYDYGFSSLCFSHGQL